MANSIVLVLMVRSYTQRITEYVNLHSYCPLMLMLTGTLICETALLSWCFIQ